MFVTTLFCLLALVQFGCMGFFIDMPLRAGPNRGPHITQVRKTIVEKISHLSTRHLFTAYVHRMSELLMKGKVGIETLKMKSMMIFFDVDEDDYDYYHEEF